MASGTPTIFNFILASDIDAVRRLLDHDAQLVHWRQTEDDGFKWTPLQLAAAKGELEICRLLVERGAEVYTNPMSSYPPVIQAAWNRHDEIVRYFLQEIPEKAIGTNRLGVTINLAAREGWIDLVRAHIAADPLAVHQRGWIGDTPLHWAAHNGFVEIVELLLDNDAEIEADETNCYGGKPLHWASEHSPNVVRVLLRRGALVDSRNIKPDSQFFGMTPLIMNATQKDDCAEVTGLLLAAGADIAAVDRTWKNALDYATELNHQNVRATLERAQPAPAA